jgi:activator of 2-hydroxyglutaryl-CoA dehydratase
VKAIGIDIGSLTTKVVILEDGAISAAEVSASGDNPELVAREILGKALNHGNPLVPEGIPMVSTGIGAKALSFGTQQKSLTTCLARGANFLFPAARMVIDIGAESSSVIKISDRGRVKDQANQDKCAAGTGLFLQQMSKIIQVPLEEMAKVSQVVKAKAEISAT